MSVPRPSPRYREYVKAVLACGHWELTDRTFDSGNLVVLQHKTSSATVCYAAHDGGSEWNSARNMAKQAGDVCGCTFIQPRNRRRSRKGPQTSGFDLYAHGTSSEDRERRHAELVEAQLATIRTIEELRTRASREASQQARDTVRRLRHIEQLLEATYLPYTPYEPTALAQ